MSTTPLNINGVKSYIIEQNERLQDENTEVGKEITVSDIRSMEEAKHIDDFIYVLDKVIKYEASVSGIQDHIAITEEYPESDVFLDILSPTAPQNEVGTQFTDIIQYRLLIRLPGSFQNTNKPLAPGNIRDYTGKLRGIYNDPENPGYSIFVKGQYFDNLIEITCWAKTAKQANKRALWLENIMQKYSYIFLLSGFSGMRFEGRTKDRIYINSAKNIRLTGRPLTFYVRNEKIIVERIKDLEDISIILGVE